MNADGLDGGLPLFGQLGEERREASLLLAVVHVQQFAGAGIDDQRDATVPLAHGLLVDEKRLQTIETRFGQIVGEDFLVMTPDGGLREVESFGYRSDRTCGRLSTHNASSAR